MEGISVVLPAYNEAENLPLFLKEIAKYFEQKKCDYEIIVVNDGSRDQTKTVLESLAGEINALRTVTHEVNLGYGAALKSGFKAARKEWIFMTDSDRQFEIQELDKFMLFMQTHDLIIGYRAPRADPFLRKLNAWLFKLAAKIFFGLKVRDIDCAFKLIKTSYVNRATLESGGAIISMELLVKLNRLRARLQELPVRHLPRLHGKPTGANPKVIWRAIKEFWKWRLTGRIGQ